MVELVPVRIKKRKRNEDGTPRFDNRGQPSVWPAVDELPVPDGYETIGHLLRRYGGWHTNQVENLGTGALYGEAVCLVPRELAEEMAARIDSAELLSLAEAEKFCDEKCYLGCQEVERDALALQALVAERNLLMTLGRIEGSPIDRQIERALDPDDPTPGVRRAARPHCFAELRRRLEAAGDMLVDGRWQARGRHSYPPEGK